MSERATGTATRRRFSLSSQLPAYSAEPFTRVEPPQYTVPDRRRSSFRPRALEASTSRTRKETSEYHIRNGFGSSSRPWATLRLIHKSLAPTFSPTFYGGENISGSITVDFETTKKIHTITLQVSLGLS